MYQFTKGIREPWIYVLTLGSAVSLHYSQISYLWFHLLGKIYFNSKIIAHGAFPVFQRYVCAEQWRLNYSCTQPCWNHQDSALLSYISSHRKNKCFFVIYLMPHFLHGCAFYWHFYCLKWLQTQLIIAV